MIEVTRSSEWEDDMSKHNSVITILGGIVAYFLLLAFCLSEPVPQGVADNSPVKRKGKDGACMDYALTLSSSSGSERNPRQTDLLSMANSRQIRNTAIEGSHVLK
jgi:hypothetical protein